MNLPPLVKQMFGFGALGVVLLGINLAVTAALREFAGVGVEIAYIGGYASVVVIGFIACRHTIFAAAAGDPTRQFIIFLLSSIFFRSMEYLASVLLYTVLDIQYLLAPVIIQGLSFLIKFFYYRTVVFSDREKPET